MQKSEAHGIMRDVIRKLPAGWSGRCWDNCGWHVEWFNGAVKLYYCGLLASRKTGRNFWAMVGEPGSLGGIPFLTRPKIRHFRNPKSAIRSAVRYAQDRLAPIHMSLDQVEAYL